MGAGLGLERQVLQRGQDPRRVADADQAQPEGRDHEPKPALVAADAGCADLLKIIAAAPRHLAPGGSLFLETGIDQHPRLLEAVAAAGLVDGRSIQDWSERPRFVAAAAPR